jgi:putative membrane protein
MRITLLSLGAVGLGAVFWLTLHYGLPEIVAAFAAMGWGLALMIAVRMVLISGAGVAWWGLVPPEAGANIWTCLRLRWIRESINSLLPVAQMGGDLAGARLLAHASPSPKLAGASVIVDVFIQASTQLLFTLLGLAVLVAVGGDRDIARGVLVGLAVLAPALGCFFIAQWFGGFGWLGRRAMGLLMSFGGVHLAQGGGLDAAIRVVYGRWRGLSWSICIHFLVWCLGVGEIWIGLFFMGHKIMVATALVIESLAQAVRAAAFIVPGALGVQEGGFVVLCAAFGFPPTAGIALSLARRACEVIPGLAGLALWHVEESAILLRKGGPTAKQ